MYIKMHGMYIKMHGIYIKTTISNKNARYVHKNNNNLFTTN